MGYSTEFNGDFAITPPLTAAQVAELMELAGRRHDEGGYRDLRDGEWRPGLPRTDAPGVWCQWIPNREGTALEWDGGEKFYNYVEWLAYLIEHYIAPWGRTLDGEVEWQGDDDDDAGMIRVAANEIETAEREVSYTDFKKVGWPS